MPFRAVLFDFDGTLADSYDAITASVNHVRQRHGLPALAERDVRHMVGRGLLQLMRDVVPGGDAEADAKVYQAHHPSVMFDHTRLLPGVGQAIRDLHAAGLKLAVCSNKPVAITRQLLESLGVAALFEAAYGPEDGGAPKPDPAMVHLAIGKLGVPGAETLYVGDMPVDVETARNAGINVWVVCTGSSSADELARAHPDQQFDNMKELGIAVLSRRY
jgi:2-phosphoglycolate phosphatase